MKTPLTFILFTLFTFSIAQGGEEPKLNCKLTIRTFKKDGSKKIDIKEVHAETGVDCKQQAREIKAPADDTEISKVQVSHSFREKKDD